MLGKNVLTFEASSSRILDYWVTAGDSPAEIEQHYAAVTGTAPMMPEYGLGFWQCKLRYQTQDEVLRVAREYKRRGLPLDMIIIDFFHWARQGEWKFDPACWPDPSAMVRELNALGVETMVSVWPPMGQTGGASCASGADNEVWSYGERVYGICRKYLALRESMRGEIRDAMRLAHENGTPVMRPLFYDFPEDAAAWNVEDEYIFAEQYLVAPVLEAGVESRRVYLPDGAVWKNIDTGETFEGGRTIEAPAPLEIIPVFRRTAL